MNEFLKTADLNSDAKRALTDVKAEVRELTGVINEIIRESGAHFVGVSMGLQSLFSQTDAMYQSTQGHDKIFSLSGDENLLSGVGETATLSLAELRQSQRDNTELFQRISETLSVIKHLLKSSESISNMGGQLEIIGINLAIQTSRHRHGTETFEDFSSEIKGFSAYTRRFAEDIQQDANDVGNILSEVRNQLDKKIKSMEGFIEQAEQNTGITLNEIKRLVSQSMNTMSQKAIHSKNISTAVNNAIIAIQIDDITRQRMEHINEALLSVVKETNSLEVGAPIIKLQASQLREVGESIKEAKNQINTVFRDIGKEIIEIDSLSSKSSSDADGATMTSLKNLKETLCGLDRIHAEAKDVKRSIAASLDSAVQSSERISRHIVDVSIITQELNLKAINALLMSRDLGSSGNNLVVLAKELHSLSKESIDFVDDLKRAIEHVEQVTINLKKSILEQRSSEVEENLFSERLNAIDAALVSLRDASISSHRISTEINENIEEISSKIREFASVVERISECETHLDKISTSLTPYLDESAMEHSVVLDELYHKYTMEEERKLHRHLHDLGGSSPKNMDNMTTPAHLGSGSDEEGDDLGDFELF